ncbi:hypothetical protein [Dietzia aurantiaca]|uniref:Sirohydrochlorin chelatase n=1 Tax=Dietzia aurantiaca TaxID=983873 RepID=A0ABV9PSF5_9ACTN
MSDTRPGAHTHSPAHRPPSAVHVVAAVGPEAEGMPDPGVPTARPGRALGDVVEALATGAPDDLVVVVPLSFGRSPAVVADCSRTLRDLRPRLGPGRLALTDPFGDASMLVTGLRSALRRHPDAEGALVMSPGIDPFADAELFRVARLARQYGRPALVEVAFDGGVEPDPDLAGGLARLTALGVARPVIVPATLAPAPVTGHGLPGEGIALFGPAVVRSVLDTRAAEAVHRLEHGRDGIDAALEAEDGHGYAHSHVAADGTVYTHSH